MIPVLALPLLFPWFNVKTLVRLPFFLIAILVALHWPQAWGTDVKFKFDNATSLNLSFYDSGNKRTSNFLYFYPKGLSGFSEFYQSIGVSQLWGTVVDSVTLSPKAELAILQTDKGLHLISEFGTLVEIPLPDLFFQSGYDSKIDRRSWLIKMRSLSTKGLERSLLTLPIENSKSVIAYVVTAEAEWELLGEFEASAADRLSLSSDGHIRDGGKDLGLFQPSLSRDGRAVFKFKNYEKTTSLRLSAYKIPSNMPVVRNFHVSDKEMSKFRGHPAYARFDQFMDAQDIVGDYENLQSMWEYRFQLESFKLELYYRMLADLRASIVKYYAKYFPDVKITEKRQGKMGEVLFLDYPENHLLRQESRFAQKAVFAFAPQDMIEKSYAAATSGPYILLPLRKLLGPQEVNSSYSHELRHRSLSDRESIYNLTLTAVEGEIPFGKGLGSYTSYFSFQELDTFKVSLLVLREELRRAKDYGMENSFVDSTLQTIKDKKLVYERILDFSKRNLLALKETVAAMPEGDDIPYLFIWSPAGAKIEVEFVGPGDKERKFSRTMVEQRIDFLLKSVDRSEKFLATYEADPSGRVASCADLLMNVAKPSFWRRAWRRLAQ